MSYRIPYYDDEIYDMIEENYSDFSNDFPEEAFGEVAKAALIELWNSNGIQMHGRIYTQQEVRYLMDKQMLYENVTEAMNLFLTKRYQAKGIKLLAWLILSEILSSEEVAGMQVEYDFKGGGAA